MGDGSRSTQQLRLRLSSTDPASKEFPASLPLPPPHRRPPAHARFELFDLKKPRRRLIFSVVFSKRAPLRYLFLIINRFLFAFAPLLFAVFFFREMVAGNISR